MDTEQIRKDWQLSRLQALKEQQEKQVEQEDDEMMYTYVRDNERKVKYNYSSAKDSLVARELARHEKSSATSHSSISFPRPLSPVFLSLSAPPLSSPPPLSPSIIKHSSKTINTQRRRLQIVSSPPPSPLSPIINRERSPSPIIQSRHSNSNYYLSKSKTNTSTRSISRLSPIPFITNTNSSAQQKVLIINSSDNFRPLGPIVISNIKTSPTGTFYRIQSSQTNQLDIICQIQNNRLF